MRLIFFLGGLAAGAFTTFRIPHLPEAVRDLLGNDGHDRWMAVGYTCVTLVGVLVTYLCVKEVFDTRRPKNATRESSKR